GASGTGAGKLSVTNSAVVNVNAAVPVTNFELKSSGTLQGAGTMTSSGTFDLMDTATINTVNLNANGTLAWTGGTMSGTGTTTVAAGGVLTISGGTNKFLEGPSRVLTNNSVAGSTWSGLGYIDSQPNNPGTFNNAGALGIQNA